MKQIWKHRIIQALWIAIGIGAMVLFGAAVQQKNKKVCANIQIEIVGDVKHMFLDEKDILTMLNEHGNILGKAINLLDIQSMEQNIQKNPWVQHADLFFNNQQILNVSITERQPIARVFTVQGNSFYIDDHCNRLPLSDKISASVPIFTNYTNGNNIISLSDSVLLSNVAKLGKYIVTDSFFMAQIAQINITPNGTFELIPLIGNHIIVFGDANDVQQKFNRLYTFYKQAWFQNGINKYQKINVQFNNQIVAERKNQNNMLLDSAKTLQTVTGILKQKELTITNELNNNIVNIKNQNNNNTNSIKPKAVMQKN